VKQVGHAEAERLFKAIQDVKIMAPPTDCLSPIGAKTLIKGLQKGLKPDFIAVSSRPPAVYRGRPFLIEAGVAFGGNLPSEDTASVHRFANRVPLQYQQSACATFKSVLETDWKRYGLQQPRGALPVGPLVVMIHMASVWVPFTSESKEAIADYDEIRKEMRLALMECGRKLGIYLRRRQRMKREGERRSLFERYIGEVAKACGTITGLDPEPIYEALKATAAKKTERADIELDEEGNLVKSASQGAKRRDELMDDETVYMKETPEEAENFGLGDQPVRRSTRESGDDDDDSADREPESGAISAEPKPATKKKVILKKVKKKKRSAAQSAGLFT
jgi:DNA topoisomerase-6 subunit B